MFEEKCLLNFAWFLFYFVFLVIETYRQFGSEDAETNKVYPVTCRSSSSQLTDCSVLHSKEQSLPSPTHSEFVSFKQPKADSRIIMNDVFTVRSGGSWEKKLF